MIANDYLSRSQLYKRLREGPNGALVELYAARLVEVGLSSRRTWRSINLVSDLLSWIASSRSVLTDLDERMVDRYLRHRVRKQSIQRGNRIALKRWLSVLRDAGTIAPPTLPAITPQDQIFAEFADYLERERGLESRTIIGHLPTIRRFLHEVCPAGRKDLRKISPADVLRYVEHHARDGSPKSGKAMCWSLRAFLRYVHYKGLNRVSLAGCVPSIREWKFAHLPTYLSTEQVQDVLDGCDRASAPNRLAPLRADRPR